MSVSRQIVIIGGGFAGTTLAQALERNLPPDWRVVLISEESYTTFNPMLAEVVGAAVFPEHVVAPIRQMLKRSQFVMGRVTDIDFEHRRLLAQTLAGPQKLAYEHVVLAFGTRANMRIVPGMAEHAMPLKLVGDAMHIRNRVLQRMARIEIETDAQQRQRLGHFIVIGGGFSGVEVAGSLADFLRSARRYYPRVQADELRITLLQDLDRLLLELPSSLGREAERSLAARHVDVRLNVRAASVQADGVVLADGEFIPAETVICTIGTKPNPLVDRLSLATQRGRIETAPDLSVVGVEGAWAIGDCALVQNTASGSIPRDYSPPTAQFAVAQAKALARNIVAHIAGQPTRAFGHRSRGMMATTGHLKGVAEVFGVRLHGLAAWMLWRAYYLMLMPTLGRKVRIWVEWTWCMFFAADITHLRFTRTGEVDEESRVMLGPAEIPTDQHARTQPAP